MNGIWTENQEVFKQKCELCDHIRTLLEKPEEGVWVCIPCSIKLEKKSIQSLIKAILKTASEGKVTVGQGLFFSEKELKEKAAVTLGKFITIRTSDEFNINISKIEISKKIYNEGDLFNAVELDEVTKKILEISG